MTYQDVPQSLNETEVEGMISWGSGREQARQLPWTAAPPTGKAEHDPRQQAPPLRQ